MYISHGDKTVNLRLVCPRLLQIRLHRREGFAHIEPLLFAGAHFAFQHHHHGAERSDGVVVLHHRLNLVHRRVDDVLDRLQGGRLRTCLADVALQLRNAF